MTQRTALEQVIQEMRQIALVAGQCSCEGPEDAKALMAAAEAERLTCWADQLAALADLALGAQEEKKEKEGKDDDAGSRAGEADPEDREGNNRSA